MMSQTGIVDIMHTLRAQNDSPRHITIETNGTQAVRKNFDEFFTNQGMYNGELFWSVSPKLGTSGEKGHVQRRTVLEREPQAGHFR